ncbi:MAG: hypothetical protein IIB83_02445 [Bacteroidetes bacterium]|nr:hypothetical protein [Bacteroidota bacterium]
MKVIDHIEKAEKPFISFELIPPKRGGDITGLLNVLDNFKLTADRKAGSGKHISRKSHID